MKQMHLPRSLFILLAVVLALGMVAGTVAFAQHQARALTEIPEAGELSAEEALELMEMPVAYIDGVTPGLPPDDNPLVEGSTASPEGVDATFKYYMVSGATLRGRSSTATYTYGNLGCVYSLGAATYDRLLNTELQIPDDATIKYLRLYYYDTNPDARARGFLTYYKPGSSTTDLITINDTAMDLSTPGYTFVVSSEVTHTVNNATDAYTLIGWPSAAVSNVYICGMRVAYYDPVIYRVSMPIIRK